MSLDPLSPLVVAERDLLLSGWRNDETGELFEGVTITASDVVADIGCSAFPRVARFCAARGARTILVDTDLPTLAQLRERLSDVDPALYAIVEGTEGAIPLADGTATKIVSTEVLEHVDDPVWFMRELVRIGRSGAQYILAVPDPLCERLVKQVSPAEVFRKPNHVRIFEREEFADLVRNSGLTIERQTQVGFFYALNWVLFWADTVDPATMQADRLDSWARTWGQVLDSKNGQRIKKLLDSAMPKSQIIIARKP
jgi:SAM-dependent methyltransferase